MKVSSQRRKSSPVLGWGKGCGAILLWRHLGASTRTSPTWQQQDGVWMAHGARAVCVFAAQKHCFLQVC